MQEGLLTKGGGHAMAAGFKLDRRKEGDVQAMLGEGLAVPVAAATASRPLAIDGALSSGAANIELMELLERAGLDGAGHPEPRFVFPAHRLSRVRIINDEHFRYADRLETARASKRQPSALATHLLPSSCGTARGGLCILPAISAATLERQGRGRADRRGCRESLGLTRKPADARKAFYMTA